MLLGIENRLAAEELRDQLLFGERFVHFGLHLGLVEIGLDRGSGCALLEQIVLHLDAKIGQRGFSGLHF